MTNVLDPQSLETEAAFTGHFFYEEPEPLYAFVDLPEHPGQKERYLAEAGFAYSYCFWLANRDTDEFGTEPLIELNDDDEVTTVSFDSSGWREPVFKWQIVRQNRLTGDTRSVQLRSTPKQLMSDSDEPAEALEGLLCITEDIRVKEALIERQRQADHKRSSEIKDADEKLERLAESRQKLGIYALRVVAREYHGSVWYAGPSNDYASPLDRLRRDMKKAASFMEPTVLYLQPEPVIWSEEAKQAFLAKMAALRAEARRKQ